MKYSSSAFIQYSRQSVAESQYTSLLRCGSRGAEQNMPRARNASAAVEPKNGEEYNKKNRRQQDSNLRRQSPTDFESVSLTTRTYRRFQFGNMIFIIIMDMSWKSVSKHKIRALSTHTRVAGCMFCSNSKAIPASLQSVF